MARRKKPIVQDDGPAGAPEWIVTFTDMISLLVTFFVLLMTFSSLDAYDLLKIDALLSGEGGILSARVRDTMPTPPRDDVISATDAIRGARIPHVRSPDELPDNLVEMGLRKTEEHLELDFDRAPDGLVIEFGPAEDFAPGSSEIPPSLRRSLGEIGRVLEHYPLMIVVEGSAGDAEPDGRPSRGALAFARAAASAQVLLQESGMSPTMLQTAALEPATLGPASRAVQLRILSPSKARLHHLEAQRRVRGGNR